MHFWCGRSSKYQTENRGIIPATTDSTEALNASTTGISEYRKSTTRVRVQRFVRFQMGCPGLQAGGLTPVITHPDMAGGTETGLRDASVEHGIERRYLPRFFSPRAVCETIPYVHWRHVRVDVTTCQI